MTTLKQATIDVLNSYQKGQGATYGMDSKLLVSDLTVSYLNGVYSFKFQSEAHKDAYLTMLMFKEVKDKNPDYIQRLFAHLGDSDGAYLSLNHTSDTQKVAIDKYAQFKQLFDSLGVEEVRSNGKGSKLTQLICTPTPATVTALATAGFSNITPLVENFAIVGLKVELPKGE